MGTPKILIVDDESRNVKLLMAMISFQEYQMFSALSGKEALELVNQVKPDLILLDVMMPGMNGFEVCQRLKEDDRTRALPVLMVTALSEKEHRIRAMEAGADDFLSKPVDQTELLIRVKSLLRIKSYHDELREKYQEIAEKNKKLEELEKAKEGLTHMIIHDLNNPLQAISGQIELMLMGEDGLTEGPRLTLHRVLHFCRELKQQIQCLLDVYRMEKGGMQLEMRETDIVGMVDEVISQMKVRAESKKISLAFHQDHAVPSIKVDGELLKRVIANLMDNAIRHTPAGGAVDVLVGFQETSGVLRFMIKDSGPGLAPEYREVIFNKFEQVKFRNAGARVGSSGLGLAFCKMAVEAHGGRIWVESEGEGKGCCFNFIVPA